MRSTPVSRAALHVLLADEAYRQGPGLAREATSTLRASSRVAQQARADRSIPRQFLSGNADSRRPWPTRG
jgi:hypothetical protein